MKVDFAAPTPVLADSVLVLLIPAVIDSTIGRPSFSRWCQRRARPFDVGHYQGLRQNDWFLDSRRFFAYCNPDPTETHVLITDNRSCRTAFGSWDER